MLDIVCNKDEFIGITKEWFEQEYTCNIDRKVLITEHEISNYFYA